MVAAQHALSRATKTLAAMPRLKQQRQRFLQQPQKLVNFHLNKKKKHSNYLSRLEKYYNTK
jgi:Tfp pilus assembly protein PilN